MLKCNAPYCYLFPRELNIAKLDEHISWDIDFAIPKMPDYKIYVG